MYELKNMFLCIATLAFVFQLHAVVVVCDKHNSGVSFEPAIHHHCDHDHNHNRASDHDTELTDADEHQCSPCTDAAVDLAANLQKSSQRRILPQAVSPALFGWHRIEPAAALYNYTAACFQSARNISSVILLI